MRGGKSPAARRANQTPRLQPPHRLVNQKPTTSNSNSTVSSNALKKLWFDEKKQNEQATQAASSMRPTTLPVTTQASTPVTQTLTTPKTEPQPPPRARPPSSAAMKNIPERTRVPYTPPQPRSRLPRAPDGVNGYNMMPNVPDKPVYALKSHALKRNPRFDIDDPSTMSEYRGRKKRVVEVDEMADDDLDDGRRPPRSPTADNLDIPMHSPPGSPPMDPYQAPTSVPALPAAPRAHPCPPKVPADWEPDSSVFDVVKIERIQQQELDRANSQLQKKYLREQQRMLHRQAKQQAEEEQQRDFVRQQNEQKEHERILKRRLEIEKNEMERYLNSQDLSYEMDFDDLNLSSNPTQRSSARARHHLQMIAVFSADHYNRMTSSSSSQGVSRQPMPQIRHVGGDSRQQQHYGMYPQEEEVDSQDYAISLPPNGQLYQYQWTTKNETKTILVPMAENATQADVDNLLPQLIDADPSHVTIGTMPARIEDVCDAVRPVLVNPRQYQRILKRREMRDRLEVSGQIPIKRQKYMYESRHAHAVNRKRSVGGKFNKAKGSEDDDDEDMEEDEDDEDDEEENPENDGSIETEKKPYALIRPAGPTKLTNQGERQKEVPQQQKAVVGNSRPQLTQQPAAAPNQKAPQFKRLPTVSMRTQPQRPSINISRPIPSQSQSQLQQQRAQPTIPLGNTRIPYTPVHYRDYGKPTNPHQNRPTPTHVPYQGRQPTTTKPTLPAAGNRSQGPPLPMSSTGERPQWRPQPASHQFQPRPSMPQGARPAMQNQKGPANSTAPTTTKPSTKFRVATAEETKQ